MTRNMRLFEVVNGLLSEVNPDDPESVREGHRVRRIILEADVLLTPDEEAARDAEELAASQVQEDAIAAKEKSAADRASALEKLKSLGLSQDEVAALIG